MHNVQIATCCLFIVLKVFMDTECLLHNHFLHAKQMEFSLNNRYSVIELLHHILILRGIRQRNNLFTGYFRNRWFYARLYSVGV